MRAVIQRVTSASVKVDDQIVSKIGQGLVCLIGLGQDDDDADAEYIARKILNCRLWPSDKKAWDLSVMQQNFEVLCVSQFTLYGRLKGNKCDFSQAMGPQQAREFYENFVQRLQQQFDGQKIKDGVFGAMMQVELVNDGPVTFILDSKQRNGAE